MVKGRLVAYLWTSRKDSSRKDYLLIKVIKREKKTANSMDRIMLTVILLSKMVSALHGKGLMCQFQQKVLID